jgi:hypothetical protein
LKQYPIPDQTRELLRAEQGWSYSWSELDGLDFRVFLFKWPRAGSVYLYSSLEGHRPDICMPAAGFVLDEEVGNVHASAHGISFSFRQFRFQSPAGTTYAFYCLWDYGRPSSQIDLTLQDHLSAVVAARRVQERQMLQLFITGTHDDNEAAAALKIAMQKIVVPNKGAFLPPGERHFGLSYYSLIIVVLPLALAQRSWRRCLCPRTGTGNSYNQACETR